MSVDSQLMSEPFDKQLFHVAILQSGGLHTFNRVAFGVRPYVTGLRTGNKKDESVLDPDLGAELRSQQSADLRAIQNRCRSQIGRLQG